MIGLSKNSEHLCGAFEYDALAWVKISEFLEKFRNLTKNQGNSAEIFKNKIPIILDILFKT